MDMNKDIVTLPKRGLKTKPYNIGMEKMDLKTRPYSIDMEKKDLKKLTKGQLIELLLKKVSNYKGLLDNNPFKDEVVQEPTKRIKPTTPPRTGKWESIRPKPIPRKSVNEDLIYHHQMGTSLFQNQGLTDHFKCKMHEDDQNQLENHHQSLKLKSI